jgi:glutamyl-Q tRNA(Asp) synthetase
MAQPIQYIGRFAPSPTGKLHLGSLMTAIASYCDAMKDNGQWLVRIEDLDPPREVHGASKSIIKTLQNYGFQFKLPVVYQSQTSRQKSYNKAIEKLKSLDALYPCPCSRNELKQKDPRTHSCRNKIIDDITDCSLKLKVPDETLIFNDIIQGRYTTQLLSDCGDCVLKRKDGLFAYQLAVVVDDAFQGITHIIRGTDIIESTPWQIYLNSILNFQTIQYAHIPVLVNSQGQKLSKQTYAKEIEKENPIEMLVLAYSLLNQNPFYTKPQSIEDFWTHAIMNWNINKVSKLQTIQV